MRPVELLLHQRVAKELRALRRSHRRFAGAVNTAVRKLLSDPRGAGEPLHGLSDPELQGRLRKLYLGGNRERRLFYWVLSPAKGAMSDVVIPIFLSPKPRGSFDYDRIDMNAVGMDIVEDYRSMRYDRFERFRDPDVLIVHLQADPGAD